MAIAGLFCLAILEGFELARVFNACSSSIRGLKGTRCKRANACQKSCWGSLEGMHPQTSYPTAHTPYLTPHTSLHCQYLFLLLGKNLVQLFGIVVGNFLHLVFAPLNAVFGNTFVL